MKKYLAIGLCLSSVTYGAASDIQQTAENNTSPSHELSFEAEYLLKVFEYTTAPIESELIKSTIGQIDKIVEDPQCTFLAHSKNKSSSFTLLHAAVLHCMPHLINRIAQKDVINETVSWHPPHYPHRAQADLQTALHIAAYKLKPDVIHTLLAIPGIRQNARDKNGNTPLHMLSKTAVRFDDDAVRSLASSMVSQGCCPKRRNNQRKSPLDIAESRNMQTVVQGFKETKCTCKFHQEHKRSSIKKTPARAACSSIS